MKKCAHCGHMMKEGHKMKKELHKKEHITKHDRMMDRKNAEHARAVKSKR